MRLGIDVGKARIGVARSDVHGMLATPLETVDRDPRDFGDVRRILAIANELEAMELVVGLPLGMSGHRTPSTEDAQGFAETLAGAMSDASIRAGGENTPVGVRLVDERLSTVTAQGQLRQAGKKTKQTRNIIDQAAAVVILQHALDYERARGEAPGTVILEPREQQTVQDNQDLAADRDVTGGDQG